MTGSKKFVRGGGMTVVLACVVSSVLTKPAHANRKDFVFAKEWKQPSKGERELELYSTYSNGTFTQQIELDYGVTERLSIAPYLVFERERGENLRYKEFKFEKCCNKKLGRANIRFLPFPLPMNGRLF